MEDPEASATLSVTGGSATSADYVQTLTLTIPAGTGNNTLVSVASALSVVDDNVAEPSETLQLTLSAPAGASLGAQTTHTHTIINDDVASVTIADVSQDEGNAGNSSMTFTLQLDTAVQGGLVVNYATSSVTASTADYVSATGSLTFAGVAGETQTVTVQIIGDTVVEPDETFALLMPSAASSVAPGGLVITDRGTGTIRNDDTATLAIADAGINEGNAGQSTLSFTATLSSAVAGGYTVNYATANGTATTADADYVAATGSLTFSGIEGETRSFSVTVNGDTKVEADETFRIVLSGGSNAAVDASASPTGTIRNDDTAVLTIADVNVAEGNAGNTNMIFTVSLDAAVQGGFSVDYASADGTATVADNDYTAASGTLTFSGTAGQTRTVIVSVTGDRRPELDETFSVALRNASMAGVDISDTAIGTIRNDDAVVLSIADVSQDEGNAGPASMSFTVSSNGPVAGGYAVSYATSNGTANVADNDYVAATGTLTFSGAADESQTFAVTVNGDTKVEADETFSVGLSTVSAALLDVSDIATGTIRNDDTARVTITDVSVDEGNAGSTLMTFVATLDRSVQGGFTVNYASSNGTATVADNDYAAAAGTLTFAGTVGETQSFTVSINGDTRVEPDETFSVALSNASNTGVDISDTATGTIRNDDTAALTIADVSVDEGNGGTTLMTFVATLDRGVQGGFTVAYATSNGTATVADNDYTAAAGTLTFAGTAGETQSFTVSINGDTRLEADETFNVALNTVSNAAVNIVDTATGTIRNDDAAALTIADVSMAEGNASTTLVTFVARLDQAVAGGFTVNYASSDGTATLADNDYAVAAGTLTFAGTAGETQSFTVSINGDTRLEADETFGVALATVSNTAVNISDTATGTIRNDDGAAVTIGDISLAEGDAGTMLMTFTATLDENVQGGFSVDYATADGSATTADNDYVAATGRLTFAGTAGETQPFSVTINGDRRYEPDESFTVALSGVSNAAVVGTDTASGTLLNDDAAPGFIVAPTAGLVTTEAGGTASFSMALASQPTAAVTVALSSSDPGEGTVAPASLVFDAANWNSPQNVTVTGVDDALVDGDVAYTIVTAAAVSSDPRFNGLDAADVSVINGDDDAGALLSATKRVLQVGTAVQPVIYEIVIRNSGDAQADDPASDELVDVLPATLALQGATASAGSISTAGNTVRWNGALASGASVTLQITARVATTTAGPISNQAQIHYDSEGDGSNDATALSDDPTTPGLDATVFGFVPPSVAIPLLDNRTLALLALCLAALALPALRRRKA